jgi:hypothetical protein
MKFHGINNSKIKIIGLNVKIQVQSNYNKYYPYLFYNIYSINDKYYK